MFTGHAGEKAIPGFQGNLINLDGSIRVLKEQCKTCPFRPESTFRPQYKTILNKIKNNPEQGMICHSTYPHDVEYAMCNGGYNVLKDQYKNEKIAFVPEPKSQYTVIPLNEEYI